MSWKSIHDFEFIDHQQIHVDTRDFGLTSLDVDFKFDISSIKKYPDRFFFTIDEVKSVVFDLYNRSGGESEWRCLWLKNSKISDNWNLKYIRVYKTKLGYVICGNNNIAIRKDDLKSEIDQKILNPM